MRQVPVVVAYGGGIDGTAMLVEMRKRGMRPDLIQFADVGNRDAEKPSTYAHIDLMDRWCQDAWGVGISVVRNDGVYRTLENDCLNHRIMPSIVYGFKSCSEKYKLRPQLKHLKTWQPAIDCWAEGGKIIRAIGFNADEWHRVKSFDDARFTVRYPLVEWGITRRMCRDICVAEIGYVPTKSACFFCPSSKKSEVLRLAAEHPDLFARAVAMESNVDYSSQDSRVECEYCEGLGVGCGWCAGRGYFAAKGNTVVGLGRHWSWQDLAAANENQFKLFPEAPEIACMCFDGQEVE